MCFSQPKLQSVMRCQEILPHTHSLGSERGVPVSYCYKNQFLLQIQHYLCCQGLQVDLLKGPKLFCSVLPRRELFGLVHCWSIGPPQPKEHKLPLPIFWPYDVPQCLTHLQVWSQSSKPAVSRDGTGQDSMLHTSKFAHHFSATNWLTGNGEPDAMQWGFHSNHLLLSATKLHSTLPTHFFFFLI